jgi:hypothetical protein
MLMGSDGKSKKMWRRRDDPADPTAIPPKPAPKVGGGVLQHDRIRCECGTARLPFILYFTSGIAIATS